MAKHVREVMNGELFSLRPTDQADEAVSYLLALGISAAPVLDPYGKPVGYFALRDGLHNKTGPTVGERMSAPAYSIPINATVENAARLLADANLHHAAVVDERGFAVGAVSVLDVLKALEGLPVSHPPAFPHYDRETGLVWTDDTPLEIARLDAAPDGPGLLALIVGGLKRSETVAWAEACENVRTRLHELLSVPQEGKPVLARILGQQNVRFRAAFAPDQRARREALRALLDHTEHLPLPAGAVAMRM
jgi:CBS domain-containing protein